MMRRFAIVVVSDTRLAESDLSGPAIQETMMGPAFDAGEIVVVKDEPPEIQGAILRLCESHQLVFTTGGTGFSARDVTPEATAPLLERRADGLCELMRLKGLEHTPFSHLSRGIAGTRGQTLIVNLPGSPKGARQGVEAIKHLIEPILSNLCGEGCPAEC